MAVHVREGTSTLTITMAIKTEIWGKEATTTTETTIPKGRSIAIPRTTSKEAPTLRMKTSSKNL